MGFAFRFGFLLLTLSFSWSARALVATPISYYGKDFYSRLSDNTKDESLKASIKFVLRSSHIKNDSGLDEIVADCTGRSNCYSHVVIGYGRARQFLMGYFYLVKQNEGYGIREFYCDRIYSGVDFPGGKPGPDIVPDNKIINVEHTWPQSRFSRRFGQEGQKSDLHHLYPTDSEMNSIRGNFQFGEVTANEKPLKCTTSHFGRSSDGRSNYVFEPPDSHKGAVARALFYFSVRYDLPISPEEEAVLRKWHREHPVQADEVVRNDEVFKAQKNRNPFVDFPEIVDRIDNF